VKFSAQGTYFLWKKEDVLSHDWLLAGMIREPEMAVMSGDQFYIDVDSTALRFIYNLLQGIVQTLDLQHLSNMEMILIQNTAKYLLCPDIVKKTEEIVESIKNEVDFLEGKNLSLENKLEVVENKMKVVNYEPKLSFNDINSLHLKGFRCPSRCCAKKFIIISPVPYCKHTNFDLSALCCGSNISDGRSFEQETISCEKALMTYLGIMNAMKRNLPHLK
jgi:hypothetical protein